MEVLTDESKDEIYCVLYTSRILSYHPHGSKTENQIHSRACVTLELYC